MTSTASNIHNLVSLWKAVTAPRSTYFEQESWGYCYVSGSHWPNKLWTGADLNESMLQEMVAVIQDSKDPLAFSYFDNLNNKNLDSTLQDYFMPASIQYGMSLDLTQPYEENTELEYRQVANEQDAAIWSKNFEQAFGYEISSEIVFNNRIKISFINIYTGQQAVGTMMLYTTGEVLGIHGLGVVPEGRGKGVAKAAMHYALNQGYQQDVKLVTLQASEMAKSMYEKLGFSTQFIMRNYKPKQ